MESDEDETSTSLRGLLGLEPPERRSAEEIDETVKRILHRLCDPEPAGIDSVLAQAGPKLKAFRERSGWTAAEISERTGVPLQVLEAFEAGEPGGDDVLVPALELLASACCCSLEDLGLDRLELARRKPPRRERWTRPDPLW
jgi:helix-turn-helix protein